MIKRYRKPYAVHWSWLDLSAKKMYRDNVSFNQVGHYMCKHGTVAIAVYSHQRPNDRVECVTEFIIIHKGRKYEMDVISASLSERQMKLYAVKFLKEVIGDK